MKIDKIAQDYIQELETKVDLLEAENEELRAENKMLRAQHIVDRQLRKVNFEVA
jgi:cell division protein FtsB